MKEICEQRLKDKTLASQDKMFTNFYMAMLVGMMGDVEKGNEYIKQSFTSFMESEEIQNNSKVKPTMNGKTKKTAAKRRKKR